MGQFDRQAFEFLSIRVTSTSTFKTQLGSLPDLCTCKMQVLSAKESQWLSTDFWLSQLVLGP